MIQFRDALQTNDVNENDVKEVIKKLLENAPERIGRKKTQIMQMMGLMRPMLIKIWNCIVGMIFYSFFTSARMVHYLH